MKTIIRALALILVIAGAVNWGLIGAFDYNLVTALFDKYPQAVKGIYIAIGLAGLAALVLEYRCFTCDHDAHHHHK